MEVQVTRTANDRVPMSESGMVLARDTMGMDSDRVTAPSTDAFSNMPTCCSKCSSVAMENHKTKSKLDQLRLVMQQKKERREARKLKNAPYGMVLGAAGGNGAPNGMRGGLALATKNPHQSTNNANGSQPAQPLQLTQVQPTTSTTVTNNDSQDSTISLENSSADTSSSSVVVVSGDEGSSGSGVALLNESGPEEVVVVVAGDESPQQEEQSNGVDVGRAADAAAVAAEQQQQQEAEEQKQQQQQNHLVEEVDTAA